MKLLGQTSLLYPAPPPSRARAGARGRQLAACCLASAAWLVTETGAAQPGLGTPARPVLGLRWMDPDKLAPTSAREFAARLSERLGRPAFSESSAEQVLAVAWRGTPDACSVELQVTRGAELQGTRQIDSPSGDCRALAPALLTVAALLIESEQADDGPSPEAPQPSPPTPSAPPATPSSPPEIGGSGAQPGREPRALFSAGAVLGAGFAPKLELAPSLALAVTPFPRTRIAVDAAIFFRHQYGATPGLALSHESLRLSGCAMPLSGDLGLGVCASVAAHRVSASGVSLLHEENRHELSASLGAAFRVEWRLLRRVWWVGQLGVDVAPEPLYFYYTDAPGDQVTLFTQSRLSPFLFLGLTWQP